MIKYLVLTIVSKMSSLMCIRNRMGEVKILRGGVFIGMFTWFEILVLLSDRVVVVFLLC